jgi:hypothetical protein
VSFESVNYRGQYLRHQNYRIKLSDDDGSDLFRQDATFVVRRGLSGTPGTVSFESVNVPGHFIRHQNFELWLANRDAGNTMLFPSGCFLPSAVHRFAGGCSVAAGGGR